MRQQEFQFGEIECVDRKYVHWAQVWQTFKCYMQETRNRSCFFKVAINCDTLGARAYTNLR